LRQDLKLRSRGKRQERARPWIRSEVLPRGLICPALQFPDALVAMWPAFVRPSVAELRYATVAAICVVPDRRIECGIGAELAAHRVDSQVAGAAESSAHRLRR